ncbi:hypothetical protein JE006_23100 [Pseudomonas aeruginosa]|nr:hypothetical protein [Pseudomonas aeruginosa]
MTLNDVNILKSSDSDSFSDALHSAISDLRKRVNTLTLIDYTTTGKTISITLVASSGEDPDGLAMALPERVQKLIEKGRADTVIYQATSKGVRLELSF